MVSSLVAMLIFDVAMIELSTPLLNATFFFLMTKILAPITHAIVGVSIWVKARLLIAVEIVVGTLVMSG